jgi:hypothetical protein
MPIKINDLPEEPKTTVHTTADEHGDARLAVFACWDGLFDKRGSVRANPVHAESASGSPPACR